MKWCIKTAEGKVKVVAYYICSHFLAFETEEKAKLFLKEKIDLKIVSILNIIIGVNAFLALYKRVVKR
jgi:hypothetical protein